MFVVHVINDLDDGGAEAVLFRLCAADTNNRHVVISLQCAGKYGALLRDLGIAVHCLNMVRGRITLGTLWQLGKLMHSYRPDVVQTWMYHSDLIGGAVAWLVGIRRIYWGVHNTNLEGDKTKRLTILVVWLNALLSHLVPKYIVSCSVKGGAVHRSFGYRADKFMVIPNGYDLHQFAPDTQASSALKLALSIPDGVPILGMVARFDPQKDHLNLITALGFLRQSGQDYYCVLVGGGMDDTNSELLAWLDLHGVRDRILLLGQRNDIPAIMNTLDVHVLSSAGEAFPNVLCEAMACGTPCVTTDVGDSALIVGETGWVVPAKSPVDLSRTLRFVLEQREKNPTAWRQRKAEARQRILDHFSIGKMTDNYHRAWRE